MWTREGRRSQLLLIKVRQFGGKKIIIPISLTAIEQLLRAIAEVIQIINDLFPTILNRKIRSGSRQAQYSIGQGYTLVMELWKEIRRHGSWRMIEIETDQVVVEICFY